MSSYRAPSPLRAPPVDASFLAQFGIAAKDSPRGPTPLAAPEPVPPQPSTSDAADDESADSADECDDSSSIQAPLTSDALEHESSDAALSFDADSWTGSDPSLSDVVALRRRFLRALRPHDGRMSERARRMLQDEKDETKPAPAWYLAAVLSWAHHSGRAHLLAGICAASLHQPKDVLTAVLHYTPRLALIHQLLAVTPALALVPQVHILHPEQLIACCEAARPQLDTLRWLMSHIDAYPRVRQRDKSDHPLSTMLRAQSKLAAPCPETQLLELTRALLTWRPQLSRTVDDESRLPLHHASAFVSAVLQSDLLRTLAQAYPEAIVTADKEGKLPLHHLLSGSAPLSLEPVQLLSSDPAVLRALTAEGDSMLHCYCRRDVIDIVVFSFLCDAHPAAVSLLNGDSFTPMMLLAQYSGSLEAAQMLVRRAPACALMSSTTGAATALSRCVAYFLPSKEPLLHFLLGLQPSRGALYSSADASTPRLLLDSAHVDVALLLRVMPKLLRLNPALALHKDAHGDLPIHAAVRRNFTAAERDTGLELLRLLLAHEPVQQLRALTQFGFSALRMLSANDSRPPGALRLLSSLLPSALWQMDRGGNTPLHHLLAHAPSMDDLQTVAELAADAPQSVWTQLNGDRKLPLMILCESDAASFDLQLVKFVVKFVAEQHPAAVEAIGAAKLLRLFCRRGADETAIAWLLQQSPSLAQEDNLAASGAFVELCKRSSRSYPATPSVMQLLLSRAPKLASIADDSELLPLHHVVANSEASYEQIKCVLDANPRARINGPIDKKLEDRVQKYSPLVDAPLFYNLPLSTLLRGPARADSSVTLQVLKLLLSSSAELQLSGCAGGRMCRSIAELVYFSRPGPRDSSLLKAILDAVNSAPCLPVNLQLVFGIPVTVSGDYSTAITTEELTLLLRGRPLHASDAIALGSSAHMCKDWSALMVTSLSSAGHITLMDYRNWIRQDWLDASTLRALFKAAPQDQRQQAAMVFLSDMLKHPARTDQPDFAPIVQRLLTYAPDQLTSASLQSRFAYDSLLTALLADPKLTNAVSVPLLSFLKRKMDPAQREADLLKHGAELLTARFVTQDPTLATWFACQVAESPTLRESLEPTLMHTLLSDPKRFPFKAPIELMLQAAPLSAGQELNGVYPLMRLCTSAFHDVHLLRSFVSAHPPALTLADEYGVMPLLALSRNLHCVDVDELSYIASVAPHAFNHADARKTTVLMFASARPQMPAAVLAAIVAHCDERTALQLDDREGNLSALHVLAQSRGCTAELISLLLSRHPRLATLGDVSAPALLMLADNSAASADCFRTWHRLHQQSFAHAAAQPGKPLMERVWERRLTSVHTADILDAMLQLEPAMTLRQSGATLVAALCTDKSLAAPEWDAPAMLTAILTTLNQPENASHRAEWLPLTTAADCWRALLLAPRPRAVAALFPLLLAACPALLTHADAAGMTLLSHSARGGRFDACRVLVDAGASLLQQDRAGLTALAHCSQAQHADLHAFLTAATRAASMYRGRFELASGGHLMRAGGGVKFAVDCGETSADSKADASAESKSEEDDDDDAAAEHSSSTRPGAVLKFYSDAADWAAERATYERLELLSSGRYVPRLLAAYEPLLTAARGSDDSMHCLALEAGTESLRQAMLRRVATGGQSAVRWSPMDTLQVASSCISALRFLQSSALQLAHADVKPENIAQFADGWRLIDFDSARRIGSQLPTHCTPLYAPPEQASRVLAMREREAAQAVSASSQAAVAASLSNSAAASSSSSSTASAPLAAHGSYDVWSLGCVLFELRAGRSLFAVSDDDEPMLLENAAADSAHGTAASSVASSPEASAAQRALAQSTAVLRLICAATDESILTALQSVKRPKLAVNEVSLLRHMLHTDAAQRFTVDQCADALAMMLQGLSATQKGSVERMVDELRGAQANMAQTAAAAQGSAAQAQASSASLQQTQDRLGEAQQHLRAGKALLAADSSTRCNGECASANQLRAELQRAEADGSRWQRELAVALAEVDRLRSRLAMVSPEARTAKVAPSESAAGGAVGVTVKKESSCVMM